MTSIKNYLNILISKLKLTAILKVYENVPNERKKAIQS